MKKNILLIVLCFIPLFSMSKGKDIHLLNYYSICHNDFRNSLHLFVIPYLVKEKYLSSEKIINITFGEERGKTYFYVYVTSKDELSWNNSIIGYTKLAGYTCILEGSNYNNFIKRSIWKFPLYFVFNNGILPVVDGTIEWRFRLVGNKVKFLRFISVW